MTDHYAIAAQLCLNRACKEPGPCPDLEAAYLDLYDEVKRLRATGEIDRKFARQTLKGQPND